MATVTLGTFKDIQGFPFTPAAAGDVTVTVDGSAADNTAVLVGSVVTYTLSGAEEANGSASIVATHGSLLPLVGDWQDAAVAGDAMALESGAVTAAVVAAGALDGKGDWNTVTPTNLSAAQVRTELSVELARIDANISSRAAPLDDMGLKQDDQDAITDTIIDDIITQVDQSQTAGAALKLNLLTEGVGASTKFTATALDNVPKTGYALTSTDKEAIAGLVDAAFIDGADGTDALSAIVTAIGNTNINESALVAAIKAALVHVDDQANKLRIDGSGAVVTDTASRNASKATGFAVAGDEMNLVDGAITAAKIAASALDGKGDWAIAGGGGGLTAQEVRDELAVELARIDVDISSRAAAADVPVPRRLYTEAGKLYIDIPQADSTDDFVWFRIRRVSDNEPWHFNNSIFDDDGSTENTARIDRNFQVVAPLEIGLENATQPADPQAPGLPTGVYVIQVIEGDEANRTAFPADDAKVLVSTVVEYTAGTGVTRDILGQLKDSPGGLTVSERTAIATAVRANLDANELDVHIEDGHRDQIIEDIEDILLNGQFGQYVTATYARVSGLVELKNNAWRLKAEATATANNRISLLPSMGSWDFVVATADNTGLYAVVFREDTNLDSIVWDPVTEAWVEIDLAGTPAVLPRTLIDTKIGNLADGLYGGQLANSARPAGDALLVAVFRTVSGYPDDLVAIESATYVTGRGFQYSRGQSLADIDRKLDDVTGVRLTVVNATSALTFKVSHPAGLQGGAMLNALIKPVGPASVQQFCRIVNTSPGGAANQTVVTVTPALPVAPQVGDQLVLGATYLNA